MSKRKRNKLPKLSDKLVKDLYMDYIVYGEAAIEVVRDKSKVKFKRVKLYGGCECGETTKK